MALKFAYRSDSATQARYATGLRDLVRVQSATTAPTLTANASAGVFGGTVLDQTGSIKWQFGGHDNAPIGGSAITVLLRIVPKNTGSPAARKALFSIGHFYDFNNALFGGISFTLNSTGKLAVSCGTPGSGTNCFNNTEFNSVLPLTQNVPLDIWFVWTGTNAASGAELWVATNGNSPTKVATLTATSSFGTWTRGLCSFMSNFSPDDLVINDVFDYNEVAVWDSTFDPAATFGARAAFITAAAYEGYTSTALAASNVRSGTVFGPGPGSQTGTAAIPVAADVRSGTATDATTGTLAVPARANVRNGTAVDNTTGTLVVPGAANVRSGTVYDAATTGTLVVPGAANVRLGTVYDATTTGTLDLPAVADVRKSTTFDGATKTGLAYIPARTDVRLGTNVDQSTGLLDLPAVADVRKSTTFDGATKTGLAYIPATSDVRSGTYVDQTTGTLDLPAAADVRKSTTFDNSSKTGLAYIPARADVRLGTNVDQSTGLLDLPAVADVRLATTFDSATKTGLVAVPARADVRLGTAVDQSTGTCAVPSPSDVSTGVAVGATVGTRDTVTNVIASASMVGQTKAAVLRKADA